MGYQVGGACYATAGAAAAAAASAQGGALLPSGAQAYVVSVAGYTDTTVSYDLVPVGGGATVSVVAPFNAVPCGLLEWTDGLLLGWAVALAWVTVWGIAYLGRQFRGV